MTVTRIAFTDGDERWEVVTDWNSSASPASALTRAVATAEWEEDRPHAGAWLEFRP